MALIIKNNDMEFYCEEISIYGGYLNVKEFVGIEKRNVGEGLHIKLDSAFKIASVDEKFSNIKEEAWINIKNEFKKSKLDQEFFKNEGMAIFIKGQMVIGIHPDNLENNLQALNNGDMKLDYKMLLDRVNGIEEHDENWWKNEVTEFAKAYLKVKPDK